MRGSRPPSPLCQPLSAFPQPPLPPMSACQHLPNPPFLFCVSCVNILNATLFLNNLFSPTRPSGPSWFSSRDVHVSACCPLLMRFSHSIHPPLRGRRLYKALSHGFCACSGVLKITLYCVEKLGTVHQTADSCTP